MNLKRLITPICFLSIVCFVLICFSYNKDNYDNRPTLNILMLHMVTEKMPEDPTLNILYITDKRLYEYLEYFKERYTIVSLNEAYDIIKNNKKVDNPNLLAFTFDDGYDNNYFLAYPILKELNVKANINIIARYSDEERNGYLNWEQIKEMSDSGLIEIGNHTYDSHYYTTSIDGISRPVLSTTLPGEDSKEREKRILDDLRLADNMISNAIGKKINVLAYPYGVPPFDLMNKIQDELGYDIQLLVRPGVNKNIDSFYKLNRFTVDGTQSPSELEEVMIKSNNFKFLKTIK